MTCEGYFFLGVKLRTCSNLEEEISLHCTCIFFQGPAVKRDDRLLKRSGSSTEPCGTPLVTGRD
jgi:hypothetical protein